MEPARIVHVLIRGRVHGVGFRAWTQHNAELRGLEGWVRNRRDGSVEALVEGDAAALAEIEAWARHGPPGARVQAVAVEPAVAPDNGAGIVEIRPTA